MRRSTYLKAGTILAGVATLALAPVATAQEAIQEVAEQEEATSVGDIVVTGSRIRRPNIEAATPVAVVDAGEIEALGTTNLMDAMARQPQVGLGSSASSTTNTVAGQGLATLNLRNMGTSRTLVLVNGRRHVAGSSGTSAVDVNTISKTTIARVDTVTGGSSAVYGADAVAGVVNFITRQNFDGIEAQTQYGAADGPSTYYGSVSMGRNFNDDRTNILGAVTYDKAEGLYRHQRDYAMSGLAYIPNPDKKSANDGLPSFIAAENVYTNITNNWNTPVIVTPIGNNAGYSLTFTPEGKLTAFDRGQILYDGQGRAQKVSIGGDGFRLSEDNLRTPVERIGGELQLRHRFNASNGLIGDISVFGEAKYFHTEASSQRENGTFAGDADGSKFVTGNAYRLYADNAFMPTELKSMMATNNVSYIDVTRNDRDFGIRTYTSEYDLMRFVGGVDGSFANGWRFEAYMNYGETKSEFVNFDRLQKEFYQSIDAVTVNGQVVCRDVAARAAGCQPLNLFGAGIASQEAIDYSYIHTVRNDVSKQWNAVASVTGEAFSYPSLFSGTPLPVSFATGVEWRREYGRAVPDINAQKGLIFQNTQQITEGEYESKEVFAEVNLPLLADVPFVQYLDLTAAYRWQDYTTTGSDSTYGVGLEWTVNSDIRFRGNFARAVRAPNINELFGGGSVGYNLIEDPCDSSRLHLGNFPGNRAANCAALGLSSNFVQSTTTKPVESAGNANLTPEEGETMTLGVVLTPSFIPGLAVTVDHYKIEMSDVIASLGWRNIINNCVDSPTLSNPFCSSVTRGSDGNITSVVNQVLNVAEYVSSGWDVTVSYRRDLTDFGLPDYGSLTFTGSAGFLDELTYDPVPGDASVRDEQAGELPNPKRRINFRATWDYDKLSLSYANQYLSSMLRSNQDPAGAYAPFKAPSWMVHDLRAEYRFDKVTVFGGINNIADEAPPQTPFTWLGTSLSTGFNGSIYNNLGRYTYIGMSARF